MLPDLNIFPKCDPVADVLGHGLWIGIGPRSIFGTDVAKPYIEIVRYAFPGACRSVAAWLKKGVINRLHLTNTFTIPVS